MSSEVFNNIKLKYHKKLKGDLNKYNSHVYNKTIHTLNAEEFNKIFKNSSSPLVIIESNNKSNMDVASTPTFNGTKDINNELRESNVNKEDKKIMSNGDYINTQINNASCENTKESSIMKSEPIYNSKYVFEELTEKTFYDITKLHKRDEFYVVKEEPYSESNFNTLMELLTYSKTKLHPFSFSNGQNKYCFNKNKTLKFHSPKFIHKDHFCQVPKKFGKDEILSGNVIHKKKGLVLVDKHILNRFKGIVANMISQILKRMVGGPPVSLNVRIFGPQSSLQRNIEAWSYAPLYLKKASNPNISPIERMKQTMAFIISGFIITCKQIKPFNPLIGETFEGEFPDGTKVYAEHIGHYPTISRFYIIDKNNDYKLHGYFDLAANSSTFGGTIIIIQNGDIHIEFPKINEKITYHMPKMKLDNCRSEEERVSYIIDYLEVFDLKNKLLSTVKFGYKDSNINEFIGSIYKSEVNSVQPIPNDKNEKYIDTLLKYIKEKDTNKQEKIMSSKKYELPLSIVTGSFVENLLFDNKEYWNISTDTPFFCKPCEHVLPSDTRYREDLIWLYYACYFSRNVKEYDLFMSYSQDWKLETEKIQRAEREIKAEANKKFYKNKK